MILKWFLEVLIRIWSSPKSFATSAVQHPKLSKTWGYPGWPFNLWQGRRHLTRRDRLETQDIARMLVSFRFIPLRCKIDDHWCTSCNSDMRFTYRLSQSESLPISRSSAIKSSTAPSLSIPRRDGCNMMQRLRQSSFAKLMEQRGLNSTWS